MMPRKDLWNLVDQMENPLRRVRGATEVLFKLCDAAPGSSESDMMAFVADGLEESLDKLKESYEALHEALSDSDNDKESAPLHEIH